MNLSTLKSDINFLCGSTSATYQDVDKVRNMNVAYHDVARTIWESDGDWRFDDSNNTDAPLAYKTLGHASASYVIPTTAMRIEGVEVKDNNGDWTKLSPLSYHEMAVSPEEIYSTPGLPMYYQLEGNEVRLFPSPSSAYATLSSGMLVRLNRNVTEFAATASTPTPGFATPFHRILSLAASIDFTQDEQQRNFLIAQKSRLEKGLVRFYSKRATEFKTQIKPAGKKRWRQYL